MCGFAGYLSPGAGRVEPQAALGAMGRPLAHRGPDDAGEWWDDGAGFGVAHRRLSILDLSPAGSEPMLSEDGRCVLAYNGEVYNFAELRRELEAEGLSFRGSSDAEVVVQAVRCWGAGRAVRRFRGMFALAVWDRADGSLTLARDPVGIKPLYWGFASGSLVFASELAGIEAFPGFDAPVDRRAVASLLRYNYIPGPLSIYEGIRKQRPGTILHARVRGGSVEVEEERYWDPVSVALERAGGRRDGGAGPEALDALEARLEESVGEQLVADVPVGAFLSSGVDSPLIVALAQRRLGRPIRTFTVGFDREDWNEAPAARAIARHLGSDHTEVTVTEREVLDLVPGAVELFDEPFADSSQIPTCLVARLARESVKVVLSGDGGDELFGGYNRYREIPRAWRAAGMVPGRVRRSALAARVASSPLGLAMARFVAPPGSRHLVSRDRVLKVVEMAAASSFEEFYDGYVAQWRDVPVPDAEWEPAIREAVGRGDGLRPLERAMLADLATYLPDDILTKVDRCTMAVSLEARVPYLSTRVMEAAWSLPLGARVGGGGKRALREVLARHVPRELTSAGKRGFEVPLAGWLRGPLRGWAEELLSGERLRRQGLLDAGIVTDHWRQHLEGERHWHHRLWGVLMLQAWLERRGR